VVELSHAQLLEIYQVRESLEGLAARLAAEQMSDGEIAELRALLLQHGREVEHDPGHAYFQKEGDLDFHYRIVQGSGNGRLVELLCNDLYQLVRLYRYQFGMASNRGPRALVEHGHIVDAIGRRDGELAELLMRAHIRIARENVQHLLEERGWEK
jgi:DNA-binding GntR family transcriptional regulator